MPMLEGGVNIATSNKCLWQRRPEDETEAEQDKDDG